MSEDNKNGKRDSDYQKVIDYFQELEERGVKYSVKDNLMIGSKALSPLLPKVSDSSLFEIDDLLYPEDKLNTVIESNAEYNDLTKTLINSCIKTYMKAFCDVKYSCRINDPVLDMTLFQMIDHSPEEDLRNVLPDLLRNTISLLNARHVKRVVFVMKVLNILLKKHRKSFEEELLHISNCTPLLIYELISMSKITNIPQAKHPEKRRITSWLSRQTITIFDKLDFNTIALSPKVTEYLNAFNSLNEDNLYNYINLYVKINHANHGLILYDHLYVYFMSTKDENQKYKRLEYFLKAFQQKGFDDEFWRDSNEKTRLLERMRTLLYCFRSEFGRAYKYCGDVLRKVEKQHCHVEPYLTESTDNSNHSVCSKGHNLNEESGSIVINENDGSDGEEQDLTVEKFLYYNNYLRRQHVVTILYTAFRKFGEILQVQDLEERHEREVFWDGCFGSTNVMERLFQVSDYVPWWYENCVIKCPYLILSRHHRYLVQDLLKVVRGEEIDQAKREELYFALCLVIYDGRE